MAFAVVVVAMMTPLRIFDSNFAVFIAHHAHDVFVVFIDLLQIAGFAETIGTVAMIAADIYYLAAVFTMKEGSGALIIDIGIIICVRYTSNCVDKDDGIALNTFLSVNLCVKQPHHDLSKLGIFQNSLIKVIFRLHLSTIFSHSNE